MIPAALQEIDQRAPLLRPVSFKVAVLNVDQVEMESGDFGEIGLDQIRIVLAGLEPTLSVEGTWIDAGNEARPVIDSYQEHMVAPGGKGPVDDADLLIGLAR